MSAEVVALIAAAVAVFSAVLAVRATALIAGAAVTMDQRASQSDPIVVREGHTRRDLASDTRDYAFVIDVRTPSTSQRRLTAATLRVTYRTRANFLGAVDLTSDQSIVVPAGQTSSATLRFTTSNVIPRHCRIDAYTLLFMDGSERVTVDASLPAVLQADTDGTGPATWGWD